MKYALIFMLGFMTVTSSLGCGVFPRGEQAGPSTPGPVPGTAWVPKDIDGDNKADVEELQVDPDATAAGSSYLSGLGPWGAAGSLLLTYLGATIVLKRRKIKKEKLENEASES